MYKITYGGMMLGEAEKRAITKIVEKNWWPLGEEGLKMEQEAAKYLGVKHCVLANSGSSAGLLALSALELPKGSEVIIPATTFPTIFNIIIQCGLIPVVVDVRAPTYALDVADVEQAISKKTKAIIAVHPVGIPVDMPALMKLATKYHVAVIEDNCDGFGGDIGGKKLGSFGNLSITSFHAAHIVSMGQGGAVFTNSDDLARKVRMYRDWGRQSDLSERTNTKWPTLPKDYDARFIYEKIGYNLAPLELQAAMGRVQLKKVEQIKKLRARNCAFLYENLKKYSDFMLVHPPTKGICWFSFPITYAGERGGLVAHLEKNGIETRSMFAGNITRHPAYKGVKMRKVGKLAGADYITEHSFWISCHPRYSLKDLQYVVDVFEIFFNPICSAPYPSVPSAWRIPNSIQMKKLS